MKNETAWNYTQLLNKEERGHKRKTQKFFVSGLDMFQNKAIELLEKTQKWDILVKVIIFFKINDFIIASSLLQVHKNYYR